MSVDSQVRAWADEQGSVIRSLHLHGHGLIGEGRPVGVHVGKVGKGGCRCGAQSHHTLPSDAARKRWHKQHVVIVLTGGDSGLVTDMDRRLSE